jgi:hypothetical protein
MIGHIITFGSVCSGIEAASVAFEPLGWKAAWFSEIEPFPCALLAHHYPDVPNLGDMRDLPERIKAGEAAAPDVLCGGTPCQAFSVAGLRKSLGDARGNLSLTFCEIANAIDSVRAVQQRPPRNRSVGKRIRSAQHQRQRLRMLPRWTCWRRRNSHPRGSPSSWKVKPLLEVEQSDW